MFILETSLSTTVHMYVKFSNIKLTEDGNIETLLQEDDFIIDNLTLVAEPITEEFLIGLVLANSFKDFGTLPTA